MRGHFKLIISPQPLFNYCFILRGPPLPLAFTPRGSGHRSGVRSRRGREGTEFRGGFGGESLKPPPRGEGGLGFEKGAHRARRGVAVALRCASMCSAAPLAAPPPTTLSSGGRPKPGATPTDRGGRERERRNASWFGDGQRNRWTAVFLSLAQCVFAIFYDLARSPLSLSLPPPA